MSRHLDILRSKMYYAELPAELRRDLEAYEAHYEEPQYVDIRPELRRLKRILLNTGSAAELNGIVGRFNRLAAQSGLNVRIRASVRGGGPNVQIVNEPQEVRVDVAERIAAFVYSLR